MATKVFKYGDSVDTDVILPARYLALYKPESLAAHCMEDLDPTFVKRVNVGDVIVAGENFGCGSSREHAPLAIKSSGIKCVIAKSFSRIFYRNAINIGLPIIELPQVVDKIREDDLINVDFSSGLIINETTKEEYDIGKFPIFIQKIINEGGLLSYLEKRLVENGDIQ